MPFEIRTFILCFRLAFAEEMTPRRRRVVWTLLFLVPALVVFDMVCLALDQLLFPGYRNRRRQTEFIDGIRVIRVWTVVAPQTGILPRLLNHLSFDEVSLP